MENDEAESGPSPVPPAPAHSSPPHHPQCQETDEPEPVPEIAMLDMDMAQTSPNSEPPDPEPGLWSPVPPVQLSVLGMPSSPSLTLHPPRGFFNIGNTCFMNAVLQNLVGLQPLGAYFLGDCFPIGEGEGGDVRDRRVVRSFRWLLEELYGEAEDEDKEVLRGPGGAAVGVDDPPAPAIMPSRILYAIRSAHPIFRGFHQHDSQEFLRLFLDSLAEESGVPHFNLVPPDPPAPVYDSDTSDPECGSTDTESTESYATCDSGNGSEERLLAPAPVKITLRSYIADLFDGAMESSVQCLSCHENSTRIEVFQDLSLPIPSRDELIAIRETAEKYGGSSSGDDIEQEQSDPETDFMRRGWIEWIVGLFSGWWWGPGPTLRDCFSAFFSSDELKGENMYSCTVCGKLRNGLKRSSLRSLPEILTIHLKRFRMYEWGGSGTGGAGGGGYSSKLSTHVEFPLDGLDLGQWLHPAVITTGATTTYKLVGLISHMGSVQGGHYTAYVRRTSGTGAEEQDDWPDGRLDDSSWFLADDSRIIPVETEVVRNAEAYVLFYQKDYGIRPTGTDDDFFQLKTKILGKWLSLATSDKKGSPDVRVPRQPHYLVSRKWLTRFLWTSDPPPLDNSDVVCPHGFRVPLADADLAHLGAWVPEPVWEFIMDKFGGGPSLSYPPTTHCPTCSLAWRKFLRTSNNTSSTSGRRLSCSSSGSYNRTISFSTGAGDHRS